MVLKITYFRLQLGLLEAGNSYLRFYFPFLLMESVVLYITACGFVFLTRRIFSCRSIRRTVVWSFRTTSIGYKHGLWALSLSLNIVTRKRYAFHSISIPRKYTCTLSVIRIRAYSRHCLDLGLKFNITLNPRPHIKMICCEAFKVLGFIMRIALDFELELVVETILRALVRPIKRVWRHRRSSGRNCTTDTLEICWLFTKCSSSASWILAYCRTSSIKYTC